MKFNFYNVFIKKTVETKEQLTDLSFRKIIEHVENQSSENKTQKIDGNYYSMPRCTFLDNNSDCIFWIGKFLDDKPFESSIGTNKIKQIEGDAYQPVLCYYSEVNKMLMVQNLINGPRANKIAKFFENYLEDNKYYGIEFIQQKSQIGLDMVDGQTEILNVKLELKTKDFDIKNLFFQNGNDNSDNLLAEAIKHNIELAQDNNVPIIEFKLKRGRYKANFSHNIITLIQLLNNDNVSLLNGKVDIKDLNGQKKTIDIKQSQYLTFEKNFGDFTGYEVLMQGLKEVIEEREIPSEARGYLGKKLLNKFIHDNAEVKLLSTPRCAYHS